MLTRTGRRRQARPYLDAALGQFQRISMTGWLRRAEQLANLPP